MPQWEYRRINLGELPLGTNELDLLNDAGEEDWELIAITINGVAYLKRQVKVEAATAPRPVSSRRKSTPKTRLQTDS
jgi:hypothetical protein